MKILYDNVSSDYLYPLSKKDISKIKDNLPSEIADKIRMIRFGCNTKTTQEGRTVRRGRFYDIRINFCLNNLRSLILSENNKYIGEIGRFGGKIDFETGFVRWNLPDAKRYMLYILLHEIGHVVFCEKYSHGRLQGRSSVAEELWCDNYSLQLIEKILKK